MREVTAVVDEYGFLEVTSENLIGYVDDQNSTLVEVDVSAWAATLPKGVKYSIIVLHPVGSAWPVLSLATPVSGKISFFVVQDSTTLSGTAKMAVSAIASEFQSSTNAVRLRVSGSIAVGEAPTGNPSWITALLAAALNANDVSAAVTAAEVLRDAAESGRISAEDIRSAAELLRVQNEEARTLAENGRSSAEQTRGSNESTRQTQESARGVAESGRNVAENARALAEAARAEAMTYNATVTLIDNSAASTSGISTTSRRFIKDPIPAGAHIGTLQFRAHTTNVATVTVEVWEYDITTGNLTVAKSVAYSANGTTGIKTVTIDYDVVKIAYISLRNSASCVGYTAGEGYFIVDVATTTLAFAALGYVSTVKLSVTLAYTTTVQIRNVALSMKNKVITVGANGDYQTIQAAATASLPGGVIKVYSGVYREQVKAYGKELHIIGVNRETCILIDSSADYRTPPLQMNIGSIEDMTIIEDALSPVADATFEGHPTRNMAYCIHADSGTGIYGVNDIDLVIKNCILINANRPTIGLGTYAKQHVKIDNCDMRSGLGVVDGYHRGALYFHNNASNGIAGQSLEVRNSRIYCDDAQAVYALDTGATGGTFSMEFVNNAIYSAINGKTNSAVYGTFSTSDSEFKLSPVSYGNSVVALNA